MTLVAYSDQMNSGSRNQVSPGARSVWVVTMKFSPVRMEPKPGDENAGRHRDHVGVRVGAAVGRVKRPAGIDAAEHDGYSASRPPALNSTNSAGSAAETPRPARRSSSA